MREDAVEPKRKENVCGRGRRWGFEGRMVIF